MRTSRERAAPAPKTRDSTWPDLSARTRLLGPILPCMVLRKQVEIRDEDVEPLQALAWRHHRSFVEEAGFLLHLKIQEEQEAVQQDPEPVAEVAV